MMMAGDQNLHHATDAAAMAAAMDLLLGKSSATATATAVSYVQTLNGYSDATVTVNIPPTQGAYAGQSTYVEVIASRSYTLQLMQLLSGTTKQTYQVRSVAGYANSTAGGVIDVLDPSPPTLAIAAVLPALPLYTALTGGLEVLGLGQVSVNGAVLVNTDWGGVDQNGNPAGVSAGPPYGISCTALVNLTHLNATNIRVVGGVDNPLNYGNYTAGSASPLLCNQLTVPDPLISLAVPTTTSDPTNVSAHNYGGVQVVQIPLIGGTTVLQPGVYDWIEVDSGTVIFEPGIYIIRNVNSSTGIALNIQGGTVTANGVMFYVTNSTAYDATTGLPDSGDGSTRPATPSQTSMVPSVLINAALTGSNFSPLASTGSPFNGMLVYQRREDYSPVVILQASLLGATSVSGTIYAKWGQVLFEGIGAYNMRIVGGTVRLDTVLGMSFTPSSLLSAAQDVSLVE
jgi:hypothetical protein